MKEDFSKKEKYNYRDKIIQVIEEIYNKWKENKKLYNLEFWNEWAFKINFLNLLKEVYKNTNFKYDLAYEFYKYLLKEKEKRLK